MRFPLACFFSKKTEAFLLQSSTSLLKSNVFFFPLPISLQESIFISFNRSTLKAGHVVSTFSVIGRRSSIHRAVFEHLGPSPSYFQTSHDPPSAAETRGKVAALRRLDTGWNRQHSTPKSSYAGKHIPLWLPWSQRQHAVCFGCCIIGICPLFFTF